METLHFISFSECVSDERKASNYFRINNKYYGIFLVGLPLADDGSASFEGLAIASRLNGSILELPLKIKAARVKSASSESGQSLENELCYERALKR